MKKPFWCRIGFHKWKILGWAMKGTGIIEWRQCQHDCCFKTQEREIFPPFPSRWTDVAKEELPDRVKQQML